MKKTAAAPNLPICDVAVDYSEAGTDVIRSVVVGSREVTAARERPRLPRGGDSFADWWGSTILGPRQPGNRDATPLRFVDLFSSVGGLSLGAMDAITSVGSRPVPLLAADVDARALQVYKANLRARETVSESVRGMLDFRVSGAGDSAHFAYEPTIVDVRLQEKQGSVDLLLAGPPCQGHSSLNNHSRHQDPKNLLYLTVPAAAVALGARNIVIENVPNVVADRHGVVQTTITLLRNAGYSITSGVLSADKMGWPQTRRRYFLVASLDSEPLPLTDLQAAMSRSPMPVSWLLQDREQTSLNDDDVMNSVPNLSADNRDRIDWLFQNDAYDLPNEIRPDCHKDGTTYSATYGRMRADQPAPTLTGGFLTPGRGRFIHPTLPRVLTPREAARIQGFPDWFSFAPNPSVPPTRSEVSRWIGNAVPSILGYVATLAAVVPSVSAQRSVGDEVTAHAA